MKIALAPAKPRKITGDGWNLPKNDRHFIPWAHSGDYQDKLWKAIQRHVGICGGTIIDIGAHIGFFTERFCTIADTVIAFEPVPTNFVCLRQNVTHPNALLLNMGVGAWGSRKMYLHKADNSGSWSSGEPDDPDEVESGLAPMIPLDCLAVTGKVKLIKLDIQGMEMEALASGKNLLEKHRPVVCVEVKSKDGHDERPRKFLESLGAHVADEAGKDIIMKW